MKINNELAQMQAEINPKSVAKSIEAVDSKILEFAESTKLKGKDKIEYFSLLVIIRIQINSARTMKEIKTILETDMDKLANIARRNNLNRN